MAKAFDDWDGRTNSRFYANLQIQGYAVSRLNIALSSRTRLSSNM